MAKSDTRAPGAAPSGDPKDFPPRDRDQHAVSAARAQDKAEAVEGAATRSLGGADSTQKDPLTGRGHLEGSPDPAGAGGPTGGPAAAGADQSDERRRRISERAYYRAEQRGFSPGGEDGDWLDAEKEIDGPQR
jgi:hypothetical protein